MKHSVGYCSLEVTDAALQLTFPLVVLYPTVSPAAPTSVGMYTLEVAPEAPIKPGLFPVVLLSHGTGGSGLVYRTLAHYLAAHGFVVGLPEHPHNNRNDDSWANTLTNLEARPRHLQLALDYLLQYPPLAGALKHDSVGLIGHSLGGYTALALAGGRPVVPPQWTPDGQPHPIAVPAADARVQAMVLLAPSVPWFEAEGSLREVKVPILLAVGDQDEHTPPAHAQLVVRGVAEAVQVDFRVIDNAGHFAFLTPFPPARVSPAFPPSQDPPGFDRARFHEKFFPEVRAFLAHYT